MKILLDLQHLQDEFASSKQIVTDRDAIISFLTVAQEHDIYALFNNSSSNKSAEIQHELVDRLGIAKVKIFPLFPWRRQQSEQGLKDGLQRASETYRNLVIDEVAPDLVDHGLLSANTNSLAVKRIPPQGGPYVNVAHWNEGGRSAATASGVPRLDAVFTSDHDVRQSLLDTTCLSPHQITAIAPPFDKILAATSTFGFNFIDPGSTSRVCVVLHGEEPRPVHDFFKIYIRLAVQIQWTHNIDIICNSAASMDACRRIAQTFGLADIVRLTIGRAEISGDVLEGCKLAVYLGSSNFTGYSSYKALVRGIPVIVASNSYVGGMEPYNPIIFNVKSSEQSSNLLRRALVEPNFRRDLWVHAYGLLESMSTRIYGADILSAYELHCGQNRKRKKDRYVNLTKSRRLLFFSPLPPIASGVADYSLELLTSLTINYEIDCVVYQDYVDLSCITSFVRIFNSDEFTFPASDYDAIIYNMGNSEFHFFMMKFMDEYPGIVILHDFYLGHLLSWAVHNNLLSASALSNEMYFSHGCSGLASQERISFDELCKTTPLSGFVFRKSKLVVVHSEHARDLSRQFGADAYDKTTVVPMIKPSSRSFDKYDSRNKLGIPADALVISSFGMLTAHKNCEDIFDAWTKSKFADCDNSYLIFVGDAPGDYGRALVNAINSHPWRARIKLTGRVEQQDFAHYISASDIVVQLRSESRGETSKSILDVLTFGKPLIVNAHGSAGEWPKNVVKMISDPVDSSELIRAMETLAADPVARDEIGERGRELTDKHNSPSAVADVLEQIIENSCKPKYAQAEITIREVSRLLSVKDAAQVAMRRELAKSMRSAFHRAAAKNIFIDVTVLAEQDSHTGIQRVVKAIFQEMIEQPNNGYRIEPVLLRGGVPRYAQNFINRYFGTVFSDPSDEDWISFRAGDHYLALDWVPDRYPEASPWFASFRALGGTVTTVVYDLLPLKRPEFFPDGTVPNFRRWARAIVQSSDKIACISHSVMADVKSFIQREQFNCEGIAIGAFPLGSDLRDMKLSEAVLRADDFPALPIGKTLLMVGTLEPRKGYCQAINAMSLLWTLGHQVNLVIVGRKGWRCDDILKAIDATGQSGKKLFWLSNASDATLIELYKRSDGLLAASYEEGFGLPLSEASRFNLPVMARDIPIFREICPNADAFFSGTDASDLVEAVQAWLLRLNRNEKGTSQWAPPPSWRDAAERLLELTLQPPIAKPSGKGI